MLLNLTSTLVNPMFRNRQDFLVLAVDVAVEMDDCGLLIMLFVKTFEIIFVIVLDNSTTCIIAVSQSNAMYSLLLFVANLFYFFLHTWKLLFKILRSFSCSIWFFHFICHFIFTMELCIHFRIQFDECNGDIIVFCYQVPVSIFIFRKLCARLA